MSPASSRTWCGTERSARRENLDDRASDAGGRLRVLTRDESLVHHDLLGEVRRRHVSCALFGECVSEQERNDVGQAYGCLFGIGEPGHLLALHQGLAVA